MSKMKTIVAALVVAGITVGAYYAWSKSRQGKEGAAAAQAAASKAAVSVTSVLARHADYEVKLSANGLVTPLNTVDVRPQVTSTVTKVHIKEGQFVHAGDVLFSLDARADEAAVAKAQAQLDKDLATLADDLRQLERNKDLVSKKFIAQSVVDTSQAQYDAQKALVVSDREAVTAAKVALSYDRIVAPSAGRSGIINVFPGSLVQPTPTSPAMVTITQMDPVAVMFSLPQRNLNDALESMKKPESYVIAQLPDTNVQLKGKLQFVDNAVDTTSGTVKAKAVFDNKDLKLWPGAYVNVELSVQTIKSAIVVPQDAIIIGARDKSLYVIDKEGKAALRTVQVLQSSGNDAVVSGVEAGVRVVLDGKQNLRPGTPVKDKGDVRAAGASGTTPPTSPALAGAHAVTSSPASAS
jgi:RND family efflux transporter MFP subunit